MKSSKSGFCINEFLSFFLSPFLQIFLFFDESWWSEFYILSLWDFCLHCLTHTVSETLILKHSGFDKKSKVGGGGGEGRHEKLAEDKWAWRENNVRPVGEINTFGIAYIGVLNPAEVQSRYDKNIFDKGRKRGKRAKIRMERFRRPCWWCWKEKCTVWNSAHCRIWYVNSN